MKKNSFVYCFAIALFVIMLPRCSAVSDSSSNKVKFRSIEWLSSFSDVSTMFQSQGWHLLKKETRRFMNIDDLIYKTSGYQEYIKPGKYEPENTVIARIRTPKQQQIAGYNLKSIDAYFALEYDSSLEKKISESKFYYAEYIFDYFDLSEYSIDDVTKDMIFKLSSLYGSEYSVKTLYMDENYPNNWYDDNSHLPQVYEKVQTYTWKGEDNTSVSMQIRSFSGLSKIFYMYVKYAYQNVNNIFGMIDESYLQVMNSQLTDLDINGL